MFQLGWRGSRYFVLAHDTNPDTVTKAVSGAFRDAIWEVIIEAVNEAIFKAIWEVIIEEVNEAIFVAIWEVIIEAVNEAIFKAIWEVIIEAVNEAICEVINNVISETMNIDGSLSGKEDNVTISNGLAWCPDNKTIYYIDTSPRQVYADDFAVYKVDIPNATRITSLCWGGKNLDELYVTSLKMKPNSRFHNT